MNPDTGEIGYFKSDADAYKKGFTTNLTNREYEKLLPMTRNQRKRWNKKLKQRKV